MYVMPRLPPSRIKLKLTLASLPQLTYAHQLGGLLAYNISPSTLLFGTDYPYLPPPDQLAFDMIESSPFLDEREKDAMRGGNVKRLFAGKIEF